MGVRTIRQRITIKGQEQVIKNLNNKIRAMKNRSRKGMSLAALIIKAESMKRTPKDTGNLRDSHDIDITEDSNGINAIVSAGTNESAGYAVYVHENLDAFHPIGEARFLANALIAKQREVLEVIKRYAAEAIR